MIAVARLGEVVRSRRSFRLFRWWGSWPGGRVVRLVGDLRRADFRVAWFGRWLADLGHEPGLVATSWTVETAPDPGWRWPARWTGSWRPTLPTSRARCLLTYLAEKTLPSAAAQVRAHVALTFSAVRPRVKEREVLACQTGRKPCGLRTPEEMATLVSSRLPGLLRGLPRLFLKVTWRT